MRLLERWRSRPDSTVAADSGCAQAQAFVDTLVQDCGDEPRAAALATDGPHAPSAQARYERLLDGLAQRGDAAIAVTVSLPFCVTRCLCCDRDIQAAQPRPVIDDYIDALASEARALAQRSGPGRDVLQLHLGGGSVNELNASQLVRLQSALQQAWRVPAEAELSLDCDPRRVSWQQLQLLRGMGYSRITFGVFDLAPDVQQAIGRSQSAALIDDACRLARECGFDVVTLDLMLGLPRQDEAEWQATIQQVLTLAPDRIRLLRWHGMPAHELSPWLQQEGAHPVAQLLAQTRSWLARAGYLNIDGDLYVLETDELLRPREPGSLWHSRIATTVMPPTPLLGVGAGAVGELDGYLLTNEPRVPRWQQQVRAGALPISTVVKLQRLQWPPAATSRAQAKDTGHESKGAAAAGS